MAEKSKEAGLGLTIDVDIREGKKEIERLRGQFDSLKLLKMIGQVQLFQINEYFRKGGTEEGPWKALSPNTLANPKRGKGAQILRNTGRLAQSFTVYGVRVKDDKVQVGTEVPYAKYHHFGGTRAYIIRPIRAKVLAFWTVKGLTFRREVKHPPLPRRPMLPTAERARNLAISSVQDYVEKTIKDKNQDG